MMASARSRQIAKKRKAKQTSPKPDFVVSSNGLVEPFVVEIDNPYEYGAGNPHKRVTAAINRKTDPIIHYANTHYKDKHGNRVPIISRSQAQAGLHFQMLYYQSGATIKAMDPGKEPVDGGGFAGSGYTDMQHNAALLLMKAHDAIGRSGYMLIEQVCGHGLTINSLTRNSAEREREMNRLRRCLDIAAEIFGFSNN